MGILTPATVRNRTRKRPAHVWAPATVKQILSNETYIGRLYYRKYVYSDRSRTSKRPLEDQILIAVPAIISEATWQSAVARKKLNSELAKRNRKRDYLLSGRLICKCDRKMSGATRPRKTVPETPYYKCLCRDIRFATVEPELCDQPRIKAVHLDTLVWSYVLEVMHDKSKFRQTLLDTQALERDAAKPREEELALVARTVQQVEDNMRAHVELRKSTLEGSLQRRSVDEKIASLEKAYTDLLKAQEELSQAVAQSVLSDNEI